jgi:hypothetical protein
MSLAPSGLTSGASHILQLLDVVNDAFNVHA